MAEERSLEIVIKARDEFSETIERASAAASESMARIGTALDNLAPPVDAAALREYASGLERVMELESMRVALSQERAEAERELERLASSSPYAQAGPGEVDSEVARAYERYQTKLALLQSYNSEVITEMINAGRSQAEIEEAYSNLSIEYAKKERDLKIEYASDAFGAMSNFMENLYVATNSKNRAMFEIMKAAAIAQTTIDTYRAAQSAYAALAGIPIVGPELAVAAAAAAVAAGLARVAQIRSTEFGGGASISTSGTANPSYEGGSTEAYPVPVSLTEESQATQTVTVNIYNPLSEQNWSEIVENDIIPALNDAADRNISIKVNVIE